MAASGVRVFDPLRRKLVALTPEESVRQWFIDVLHREIQVPMNKMMSEVHLQSGKITSMINRHLRKDYRADILVYARDSSPLLLVECKRPETELDSETAAQALRYCGILGVRYMVITNGSKSFAARSDNGGNMVFLDKLPVYEEML